MSQRASTVALVLAWVFFVVFITLIFSGVGPMSKVTTHEAMLEMASASTAAGILSLASRESADTKQSEEE